MFDLVERVVERFIIDHPIVFLQLLLCVLIPCLFYKLLRVFLGKKRGTFSMQQSVWVLIFLLYLAVVFHLIQIGTLEKINTMPSYLSIHNNIVFSNFLIMIPLGIAIVLIWEELRFFKKIFAISFGFSAFVATSNLFVNQTFDIGHFITHMLGILTGYIGFKYIFIFFHKGIKFQPQKTESSVLFHNEAVVYFLLSFASVFFFYRPLATAHLLSNTTSSIVILGYEMRNVALIPVSEIYFPEEELEEDELVFPENAYIIQLVDIEEEFIGGISVCVLLGTCYEGFLEGVSNDIFTMAVYPMRTVLLRNVDNEEFPFLTCELHESREFLVCIECPGITDHNLIIAPLEVQIKEFEITDETTFEIWFTDGFGERVIRDVDLDDSIDGRLLEDLLELHQYMRVYVAEIDETYVEKVVLLHFFNPGVILTPGIEIDIQLESWDIYFPYQLDE